MVIYTKVTIGGTIYSDFLDMNVESNIGDFNATSNFAKDKTMVRIASVNSPNSSYTTSEWDIYGKDTFTYLGTHTMEAGTPELSLRRHPQRPDPNLETRQ